jgi:magnesium transporter
MLRVARNPREQSIICQKDVSMEQLTNRTRDDVGLLRTLIEAGNAQGLHDFISDLPPEGTPYVIAHISDDEQGELLRLLTAIDADLSADLLEHFPDELVADILEDMEETVAAKIVDEMDSDEQVDALAKLEPETSEAILDEMAPHEAQDVRERLDYPEDSAAGVMITEILTYPEDMSVVEVITDLQQNSEEYSEYEVRYLYCVDSDRRMKGVVRMRSLLMQRPDTTIGDLLITADPVKVTADDALSSLEDIFDRVDHASLPVVDTEGVLLGVVQRAAVEEAIGERESRNLMKFGGILGGEELRSKPLLGRSLKRLAFLMPNILLSYLAVSIIAMYEPVIEKLTALAIFLPMVANLSGAAGNQSVAVSMRELTLGLIDSRDIFRVWRKEIFIGVINGIVLGVVLGGVTYLTRHEYPAMAILIGGSYALTSILAVSFGGALPLVLRRVGVDPAMLSSPILTTLTDMASFFIVLTLAAAVLRSATG